jgi:hypothetical protein
MKGYVFDPSRLACSAKQQERDGYAVAGEMLRNYLGGGDIFAEVRERVRRDPQLRAMLAAAIDELAAGVEHLKRGQAEAS